VLLEGRGRGGSLGCSDQVRDGAARLLRPSAVKLVVKPWRLEIEVERHDSFAKRSKVTSGIRKEKRTPHAAFVRIKGQRLHS
jgi:hypothetical protein